MTCKTSQLNSLTRRLSLLLAVVVGLAALSGCKSAEEKARKAITKHVQDCRGADTEGPFYTVELRDSDDTDEVYKPACDKEITDFEMSSDVSAHAFTGPVRWGVRISKETDVWTLYVAEWPALQRALGAIEGSEVDDESRLYAESHFSKAQEQLPDSGWIRLRRLENLLELRSETRKSDEPNPVDIGEKAQTQLDETIAWARENDDRDTEAEAKYLVVAHIRTYISKIDRILSADGSSDEWLIKAAEQADKEGEPDKAKEYRDELEKTREKRAQTKETYTERREETMAYLCENLEKLSTDGVEAEALRTQLTTVKGTVDCDQQDDADEIAESE